MLRYMLDTHALIRRLTDSRKLSPDQNRVLDELDRHCEPVAICDITLLELALLDKSGRPQVAKGTQAMIRSVEPNSLCRILPITAEIALEVAAVGRAFSDPADRAIVATARIHNLRLIASDQRIIASGLVHVID